MAVSRVSLSSITQGFPKSRSFLDGNSAYLPPSYDSIATATGNGSATTFTFSSIPSTYKSLQIRANFMINGDQMRIQFNNDTGSNYITHYLAGDGTSASAGSLTYTNLPISNAVALGPSATYPVVSIVDIIDYTSTSKNKTIRSFSGVNSNSSSGADISLISGLWINTSAITSIKIINSGSDPFATGTSIALYGIKG